MAVPAFRHIRIPSPAKLNLMLHVTSQRNDGYHNLQTIFQFIDFSDDMSFTTRTDDQIKLLTPIEGVNDDENLILRAANLLKAESSCSTGFGANIRISKRIPIGGGLGGGSSNAATTLVGLNQLWQAGFSREQLQNLGRRLGADVPIFIYGQSAWAEGTGDIFTTVKLPDRWFVVLTPPLRVLTAQIFAHPDLTRDTPPTSAALILQQAGGGTWYGRNDCQSLLLKLHPEINRPFDWLGKFARAQITGTGSSVFAAFSSYEDAEAIFKRLPSDIHGFVTMGCNISPLYQTGKIATSL